MKNKSSLIILLISSAVVLQTFLITSTCFAEINCKLILDPNSKIIYGKNAKIPFTINTSSSGLINVGLYIATQNKLVTTTFIDAGATGSFNGIFNFDTTQLPDNKYSINCKVRHIAKVYTVNGGTIVNGMPMYSPYKPEETFTYFNIHDDSVEKHIFALDLDATIPKYGGQAHLVIMKYAQKDFPDAPVGDELSNDTLAGSSDNVTTYTASGELYDIKLVLSLGGAGCDQGDHYLTANCTNNSMTLQVDYKSGANFFTTNFKELYIRDSSLCLGGSSSAPYMMTNAQFPCQYDSSYTPPQTSKLAYRMRVTDYAKDFNVSSDNNVYMRYGKDGNNTFNLNYSKNTPLSNSDYDVYESQMFAIVDDAADMIQPGYGHLDFLLVDKNISFYAAVAYKNNNGDTNTEGIVGLARSANKAWSSIKISKRQFVLGTSLSFWRKLAGGAGLRGVYNILEDKLGYSVNREKVTANNIKNDWLNNYDGVYILQDTTFDVVKSTNMVYDCITVNDDSNFLCPYKVNTINPRQLLLVFINGCASARGKGYNPLEYLDTSSVDDGRLDCTSDNGTATNIDGVLSNVNLCWSEQVVSTVKFFNAKSYVGWNTKVVPIDAINAAEAFFNALNIGYIDGVDYGGTVYEAVKYANEKVHAQEMMGKSGNTFLKIVVGANEIIDNDRSLGD